MSRTASGAQLTWTDAPHEDFYEITRLIPEEEPESVIATVPAGTTSYDDVDNLPETFYGYMVVAKSDSGGSSPAYANYAEGAREDILPPGNVQATDGDHETHTAITWENRSEKTVYFRISRLQRFGTAKKRRGLFNIEGRDRLRSEDQKLVHVVAAAV